MRQQPSFSQEFTPKLITTLREGYGRKQFKADAIAGLTVAIVALPLSMAIAIGSGAKPETGLFAAVVGGFVISALGGSRFQIGGPAGAFIALVASIIGAHGYDGLLIATFLGGAILAGLGFLRLGAYVRYIPHPVLVGFTAGIALIIFSGELRDLFGLRLAHEPSALLPRIAALWAARDTVDPSALALSALCLAGMIALKKMAPRFPGMLAAVIFSGALVYAFDLRVETIGTRFGGIPNALPFPSLPAIDAARLRELLPSAVAIALLGGMESLLSAVVADGMTGRRHRSNCELVAQGCANMASALFGGLCATGTIARTATNIRAQAHGPVAGMLHSLFLLAFMLVAAPLASYVPLAALAAVLAMVAWNMIERDEIARIFRHDRGEAAVMLATFLLTAFYDLAIGIGAGVVMGALLFMHRMAELAEVTPSDEEEDPAQVDETIATLRISGAFFFGAAAAIGAMLDGAGRSARAYILDLSEVPLADAAAAQTLDAFVGKARAVGALVYVAGARPGVRAVLEANGLLQPRVAYAADVAAARGLAQPAVRQRQAETSRK